MISRALGPTFTGFGAMARAFERATHALRDLGDEFSIFNPYEKHRRRERNRARLHDSHARRSRRKLRRRHGGRILVRAPARMVR